ncbi:nuclear factor interleukin-3-regulated protein isoform X2 [Nematostella vectensis]|uniref:nuclear factor interleukin-3-regulated protein isoform X2 n=1 Tax=Nematostella vectensis TaxID=45351 RepID=UPI0013902351|nr:nuclear factor interleukin-3-regulated protein isoform X2 [Nematostella vectensis]
MCETPPSPSPSSTGSSLTDTESNESNDSGIDSVSSTGSSNKFPSDYMDIDEFLSVSGVRENQCDDGLQNNMIETNMARRQKSRSRDSANDFKGQQSDLNGQQSCKKPKDEYEYNPLPIGKKARRKFVPDQEKDDRYWARRVKNNVAARRSRDMRRQKEIEISMKWKQLEKENARLREELQQLKDRASELEKKLSEKQAGH